MSSGGSDIDDLDLSSDDGEGSLQNGVSPFHNQSTLQMTDNRSHSPSSDHNSQSLSNGANGYSKGDATPDNQSPPSPSTVELTERNLLKHDGIPLEEDGITHTDTGEESPRSASGTYTIDDAISHTKFGRFQYFMLVACGAAWATDALEVMLLTFLMPVLREEWDLPPGTDGLLGSIVFFGMMIGAIMWGRLSDRYGRKVGYLGSVATSGIFGFFSAFSPSIEVLIAFRFFVGLGLGGAFVSYSLFAEFVPKKTRGVALVAEQVLWTVGALLCVAIAAATLPSLGWQYFLVFCSLPLLLNCVVYFFIPESPRYLITHGRHAEAEAILKRVARMNRRPMIEGRLQDNIPTQKASFTSLLSPSLRRTTLNLWLIWFSVTFGYYGISFITPRFFGENDNLYMGVFITTVSEFPGLLLPALCIDRLGRKKTLAISFAIIAAASFIITIPAAASNLELDIFILFVARLFSSGAFAVTYIYTSEVYPTVVRTTGLGMTSFFSRIAGMVTTFVAEDLPTSTAMVIYGTLSVVAVVASLGLPFDTTGKDLKDHIEDVASAEDLGRTTTDRRGSGRPFSRFFKKAANGDATNGVAIRKPRRYNELEEQAEDEIVG